MLHKFPEPVGTPVHNVGTVGRVAVLFIGIETDRFKIRIMNREDRMIQVSVVLARAIDKKVRMESVLKTRKCWFFCHLLILL